jgi:hypothetical protein
VSGLDLEAATFPVAEPDPTEQLAQAQRHALNDKLLAAFKEWATAGGLPVDKWTISDNGLFKNPLGDEVTPYDAACSLQRIAEIKASVDEAVMVQCFYYQENKNSPPVLPCELRKSGQATVVIWALWDGKKCHGEARQAMPATPSVLVGIEGYGPDEAEWKDPYKVYALLEYGFKLGAFTATGEDTADEIPF